MASRISGLDEAIEPLELSNDDEWGSYGDEAKSVKSLLLGTVRTSKGFHAEGLLLSYPFAFKYRTSQVTLQVGPDPILSPLYQSSFVFHAKQDSLLTPKEFGEALRTAVARLSRAPFLYEFQGRVVTLSKSNGVLQATATDEEAIFRARGVSATEAYESLKMPSKELERVGINDDLQLQIFELQNVNPTPIREDFRTFPSTDHSFQGLLEDLT